MPAGVQGRGHRARHRDEVKARLADALVSLARERPYATITIEDLTTTAGISRSAFYFYYSDKAELLIDAAGEVVQQLFAEAESFLTADGVDPPSVVHAALARNAATFGERGSLMRMTMEVSTYDDRVGEFWTTSLARFTAAVANRIRGDQEHGLTPADLDPRATGEALVMATQGYFFRKVSLAGARPEEAVDVLADIWRRVLYPER